MSMIAFLTYDLKVAALIAVFYMFYRLLLSRETFHHVNRVVLLLTAIASYVLPLCVITMHKTVVVEATQTAVNIGGLTMMVEEAPRMPLWQLLAVGIFLLGVVATLGYTLSNVLRVWLLIRRSEQHPQSDGTVVCVVDGDVSPFSWMHYIVLSRNDYHIPPLEGSGEAFILAHERGHIRQHHSMDLLLVDTLTALQWFNPAMWMLRQDLRAIHEYEADAAVLSQGINMRQYQYLLIQKAVSHCGYSVANGISHSTLKNRIHMMLTNKKTNCTSWLKLLAMLPIVGVALGLNAETVNDYVYENTPAQPQKKIVKKGRKDTKINMGTKTIDVKAAKTTDVDSVEVVMVEAPNKDKKAVVMATDSAKTTFPVVMLDPPEADEKAFDVVEQMPQYPGGIGEMMKFLSMNIKYPVAAEKAGTQGRVIASFIVEKDGTITNIKVVKKVSEELDAEAVRVINAMPKWTPGMQNGQPVRVKYTIPISFRLS